MSKKEELIYLLTNIKGLVDEIKLETKDSKVAKSLRLTRRDMEAILGDYANIVHGGNHLMIEKLIYEVTGEVTLYDAPIDLWPQLSETAARAINDVYGIKDLDEMSR